MTPNPAARVVTRNSRCMRSYRDVDRPRIPHLFNFHTQDHCLFPSGNPPTDAQLSYADDFFTKHPPRRLWSHVRFPEIPLATGPEIIFLGRTNVGKSSLINLLVKENICISSSNRQVTKSLNAFDIGPPDRSLTLIDSPGYGSSMQQDWGPLMEKFLSRRKALRKSFVILDASIGPKKQDDGLLHFLQHNEIPHQILASKADKVLIPGKTRGGQFQPGMEQELLTKLRNLSLPYMSAPGALHSLDEDLISFCGWQPQRRFGISQVRWAVLKAAGLLDGNDQEVSQKHKRR
ncbi:hypothetical protein KEM56_006076 [Ascosphaera pollenicola]|nr:hypothetical protein KEM56_006076 [Ascosphaera pollenicola]